MAILRSHWESGQVIENRCLTERLRSLSIDVPQQNFKAGQFVRLQLPADSDEVILPAKSYSLVNAPGQAPLEVFYNIVPNGQLSTALSQLKSGDAIQVSQPANGFFVLDEIPQTQHLWMIATGTGLGPYISMLREGRLWARFEKVVLVHGVPTCEERVYQNVIHSALQQYPQQFHFMTCVTREPNPDGLQQRVTDAFASGELEQALGLSITAQHSHVMLCGNHQMLDDMKILLAQRDMHKHLRHKPGHITTEQYF